MTSCLVLSTVALKWNRKAKSGNSCRRISLPLVWCGNGEYIQKATIQSSNQGRLNRAQQTKQVHFRDEFLSFLCCGTSWFKNNFSSQCQRESVSFSTNIPAFFRCIGFPETDIVACSDSFSNLIHRVFR